MSENKYLFYKLVKDNEGYSFSDDVKWLSDDDIKEYLENKSWNISLYVKINMSGKLPHDECYKLFYLDKNELNEREFDRKVLDGLGYYSHTIKFNTFSEFYKCNWCSLLDFHCTDHNRFV